MGRSAYIKFVEGSETDAISLEELKEELRAYKKQCAKTGEQLGWDYADAAFPYTIETKPEGKDKWFYLKGKNEHYNYIIFGTGSEMHRTSAQDDAEKVLHYVQIVLPIGCTHGDLSKGNEFCKYLAKKFKAELHLFNGRVMYFNPRK